MTQQPPKDLTPRDTLLKEVKYRASFRGTLELDVVCRSLLPHLDALDDSELQAIAALLQQKEGHLMDWLVEGKPVPEEWQLVVGLVRHYFVQERAAMNGLQGV
jgi:succinate dehydrogenase flavin-adding protein (antitoxin of CptAB toxin-antitoxin module)